VQRRKLILSESGQNKRAGAWKFSGSKKAAADCDDDDGGDAFLICDARASV
jgi:hypothetical protein